MRTLKKIISVVVMFSVLMSITAFAEELTWETVPGNHTPSELLPPTAISSKVKVDRYTRGEIISAGIIEVMNLQNGDIEINVETYAHRTVDKIAHTVFLDRWDENKEDWVQVGYFPYEHEKDTDHFSYWIDSFTVSGYPVNHYYRARSLHRVELGDTIEGLASRTDGVYITKN